MATGKHGRKKQRKRQRKTMLTNAYPPARLPFTPHMPLSNPLTAQGAVLSIEIEIQSFMLAIHGRNIQLGPGKILFVLPETLYYVYFDYPKFGTDESISPTYHASEARITAGIGGRFFVGSILTPAKGAPPTIGNNDGGAPRMPTEPHDSVKLSSKPNDEIAFAPKRNTKEKSRFPNAGANIDPEVAKRRALIKGNPGLSAKEMCGIFDRQKVPLPLKWREVGTQSWSGAYMNAKYRRRIQVIITKDKRNR